MALLNLLLSAFIVSVRSQTPTAATAPPTNSPTTHPTKDPTYHPTEIPTTHPTYMPTGDPTADPTKDPTADPTKDPTSEPTLEPTAEPTEVPSYQPSDDPTSPTELPTWNPTVDPTVFPTAPTKQPSSQPTLEPTVSTQTPSQSPTLEPTNEPTLEPVFMSTDFEFDTSTTIVDEAKVEEEWTVSNTALGLIIAGTLMCCIFWILVFVLYGRRDEDTEKQLLTATAVSTVAEDDSDPDEEHVVNVLEMQEAETRGLTSYAE